MGQKILQVQARPPEDSSVSAFLEECTRERDSLYAHCDAYGDGSVHRAPAETYRIIVLQLNFIYRILQLILIDSSIDSRIP